MTFEIGETVIHQRYGPGEVIGFREMEQDDEAKRYLCIELAEDRGTLYIPEDEVERADLRLAMTDMERIREVLEQKPNTLPADSSKRQKTLRRQLDSGDPLQVAEALRDLAWRETTGDLTDSEVRLKGDAMRRLLDEMALNDDNDLANMRTALVDALDKAMQHQQEANEDRAIS